MAGSKAKAKDKGKNKVKKVDTPSGSTTPPGTPAKSPDAEETAPKDEETHANAPSNNPEPAPPGDTEPPKPPSDRFGDRGKVIKALEPGDPAREQLFLPKGPEVTKAAAKEIIDKYKRAVALPGSEEINPIGDHLRPSTPPLERAKKARDWMEESGQEVTEGKLKSIFDQATQNTGLLASLQEHSVGKKVVPIEMVNELRQMMDRLEMECASLVSNEIKKKAGTMNKLDDLNKDFEELRALRDKDRDDFEAVMSAKNKELQSETLKSMAQQEKLEKMEGDQKQTTSKLEAQVAELKAQVVELEGKDEGSQKMVVSLKDQLQTQLARLEYNKKKASKFEAQVRDLEAQVAQVDDAKQAISKLEARITDFNGKDESLKKTISSLEAQLRDLEAQLSQEKAKTEAAEAEAAKGRSSGGDAPRLESQALKDSLASAEARLQEAENNNNDLALFFQDFYNQLRNEQSSWSTVIKIGAGRSQIRDKVPLRDRYLIVQVDRSLKGLERRYLQGWLKPASVFEGRGVKRNILTRTALETAERELTQRLKELTTVHDDLQVNAEERFKLFTDFYTKDIEHAIHGIPDAASTKSSPVADLLKPGEKAEGDPFSLAGQPPGSSLDKDRMIAKLKRELDDSQVEAEVLRHAISADPSNLASQTKSRILAGELTPEPQYRSIESLFEAVASHPRDEGGTGEGGTGEGGTGEYLGRRLTHMDMSNYFHLQFVFQLRTLILDSFQLDAPESTASMVDMFRAWYKSFGDHLLNMSEDVALEVDGSRKVLKAYWRLWYENDLEKAQKSLARGLEQLLGVSGDGYRVGMYLDLARNFEKAIPVWRAEKTQEKCTCENGMQCPRHPEIAKNGLTEADFKQWGTKKQDKGRFSP